MHVPCPQCGARVELPGVEPLASCGHCGSSLHVDLAQVLPHRLLRPVLDVRQARRRLGSGAAPRLRYLPFWQFTRGAVACLVPADTALLAELGELTAFATGEEQSFPADPAEARDALPPDLPLSAVLGPDERAVACPRLLHVPFFAVEGPQGLRALDAVEGRIRLGEPTRAARGLLHLRPTLLALTALFFLAGLAPRPPLGIAFAALLAAVLGGLALRHAARGGAR